MAVAALVNWHSAHEDARRAASGSAIVAHARVETYSVLTRLPAPHRLGHDVVLSLLGRWFPATATLAPSANLSRTAVERCAEHAVTGGAVYDGLVGLTASEADAVLVTRDLRAASTYERLGVAVEFLS